MGDIGDFWNDLRAIDKEEREFNKTNHREGLDYYGIKYTVKNNGFHLIVECDNKTVDFWPSTGRWKDRKGKKGKGLINLVKYLNAYFTEGK